MDGGGKTSLPAFSAFDLCCELWQGSLGRLEGRGAKGTVNMVKGNAWEWYYQTGVKHRIFYIKREVVSSCLYLDLCTLSVLKSLSSGKQLVS